MARLTPAEIATALKEDSTDETPFKKIKKHTRPDERDFLRDKKRDRDYKSFRK